MKLSARLMYHEKRGDLENEDIPVEIEGRALDERTLTVRSMLPYCLAILTLAPTVIHFAVAGQHFQEFWLFGVVTLIAAWLQLAWAAAVVVQPSRMLWWRVGAILNSGIIVVDIAARVVASAAAFGAAASIVFGALVVAGCVWLLLSKRDQRIGRDGQVATYGALGVVTATILSIALVTGAPATVNTSRASTPALNRHGLQADVPLPAGVSFAGLHQTVPVADMQYHSNTSIDIWGWTVRGRGTLAVQNFYEANLSKHGWTHIQGQSVMDKIGNHGRCQNARGCEAAKHLTACQSGQVLLISASGTTLNTVGMGGHATPTVTAPRGGAALLIQIDKSPQEAQVVCPNAR